MYVENRAKGFLGLGGQITTDENKIKCIGEHNLFNKLNGRGMKFDRGQISIGYWRNGRSDLGNCIQLGWVGEMQHGKYVKNQAGSDNLHYVSTF